MRRITRYSMFTFFAAVMLVATAQEQSSVLSALRVETTPSGAELYINQQGPFTTPHVATDLRPGTHLITVQARGFHAHRQTVNLEAGERVPLNIELQPLTGLVLIHTQPAGAEATVNGVNKGTTPLFLTDLPLGQHTLHFSKSGYRERTVALSITGRSPIHINETLSPSSATINVESTPPGARITLNGTSRGRTPAIIDNVPEGNATVELQLEGYEPFAETLILAAEQNVRLNAELTPIPAAITIVSIPEGARIYVNNQYVGRSPVTLKNLTPGEYRIRGESPGHDPMARTVRLANAAHPTEELRLQSNAGTLVVVTQPAGAKVFIDGVERGITSFSPDETDRVSRPLTIGLVPAGEREVKLVAERHYPLTLNVTIRPSETTILQPQELKRQFIPNLEVRTRTDVHTGVFVGTLPNGDIRLEVRPGVIRRIPRGDIIQQKPLQEPTLPQ